jgi:hypothetical protein
MPWPLAKHCDFLASAVASVSRPLKKLFIGKEEMETLTRAVDI